MTRCKNINAYNFAAFQQLKLANAVPGAEKLSARQLTMMWFKTSWKTWRKYKCQPYKMLLFPAVMMPAFVSFAMGARGLMMVDPSFKTGGPALSWFYDLTVMDPYYVLPFLSCGLSYTAIAIAAWNPFKNDPKQQQLMRQSQSLVGSDEQAIAQAQIPQEGLWQKMSFYLQGLFIVTFPYFAQFPAGFFHVHFCLIYLVNRVFFSSEGPRSAPHRRLRHAAISSSR